MAYPNTYGTPPDKLANDQYRLNVLQAEKNRQQVEAFNRLFARPQGAFNPTLSFNNQTGFGQQSGLSPQLLMSLLQKRGSAQDSTPAATGSFNPYGMSQYFNQGYSMPPAQSTNTGLSEALKKLYPQLAGLTDEEINQLGLLSSQFGMPTGWGGAGGGSDNSATIAWYRDQFAQQFPEQIREFDAQLASNQQQFGQNLDWQKQQFGQSFPEQIRQYNMNLALQQAAQQQGAEQFNKQFGLSEQAQNFNQGITGRQQAQAESAQAWQKAMDEWNKAQTQSQFEWQKQATERQNQIGIQSANLGAFGRSIGPNQAAW